MKIEEIIKSKITTISTNEIVKQLGYVSDKKALEILNKFILSKDLYSWLHSGHYDFKYDSISFFRKLCEIIDIDKYKVDKILFDDKKYHTELKKFKNCYIYVNTNFKRKSEPIFALALLESKRRIQIKAKILVFKTDEQILEIISELVVSHYKETKGNIGIWGNTINYAYHNYDNKTYIFDTTGKLIENIELNESKATLKLKGKDIC